MNQLPSSPENKIRVILSKIYGDIRKSRYTTVSTTNFPLVSTTPVATLSPVSTPTLVANFASRTAGVVDTRGKFAGGVISASGKRSEQYQTAYTLK
jgi:hypothetical protein